MNLAMIPPLRAFPARAAVCAGLLAALQLQAQSPALVTTPPPAPTPQQLAEFDKNKNGVLDADEQAALRSAESAPSKVVAEEGEGEEAITLSPFDVNIDKDNGFMATNAGTATKLGLDLKDIAAPYSVMTRDFLDALNITNVQEATQWATNGGSVIDGNGSDVFGNSTMMNIRGIGLASGQQRNFFLTGGALDTYATERIDYGRGPNAVLFNVGANTALGGGISAQTKKARVDRSFETLSFTAGSWDYYRTTLDINKRLTSKFALRGNAVLFQRGGWRHYEFEKTKGLTLAATYMLTPKTELRVEGSHDKTERAIPIVPIFDNISGWDGVTVFDGPVTNAIYGTQTGAPGAPNGRGQTLTYQGEVQGVDRQGGVNSTAYYVWVPGMGQVMNWQNLATTRRGDSTARVPIFANGQLWSRNGNTSLLPFGNGGPGGSTPNTTQNGGEANVMYSIALPNDRFQRAINNSAFRLPDKRFTLQPDAPILSQRTRDANFGLSHSIGDSLFFQLTGDVNEVHERIMNSVLGFRSANIDINRRLPDGSVNPNFLQPYTDANLTWRDRFIDNAGIRANIASLHDWGKWGKYTFNLNGGVTHREIKDRTYNLSLATNLDPRKWQGNDDLLRIRQYWYAGERPYGSENVPNEIYRMNWAADRNSFTASTQTIQPRWVISGWNDVEESTQNAVLAMAAKYFEEKLIFTAGVRYDRFENTRRDRPEFGDFPTAWDGRTLIYRPDAPSDWKTLTYTPVNTSGTPLSATPIPAASRPRTGTNDNGVQARDPLYADVRFRNDYNNPVHKGTGTKGTAGVVYHPLSWLSAKANYGDSYVPPPTGAFELEGDNVIPQTGYAYDARLTFTLFKGRLVITPGYFFNREDNLRVDPPIKGAINSLLSRNSYNDGRAQSRNSLGFPDIIGTDYLSRKNTGYEVEITGQITKGWRVAGSVGTGRVDDFDRYPLARKYLAAHQAELLQVLEAAGGILDTTRRPANAPNAPGEAARNPALNWTTNPNGGDLLGAVNDYNNIWFQNETIVNDKATIGTKRIRVNFFTDYTLQSGLLRRLRMGAGIQWSDQNVAGYRSGDTVTNPNYNPALPVSATNLPYMDDASVDFATPVWIKQPLNTVATLGYSLKPTAGWLRGKEIEFQFRVNNVLNRQRVVYQDGGVQPRAPNGDFSQPHRVGVPSRVGSYQTPTSYQLTTTLKL